MWGRVEIKVVAWILEDLARIRFDAKLLQNCCKNAAKLLQAHGLSQRGWQMVCKGLELIQVMCLNSIQIELREHTNT